MYEKAFREVYEIIENMDLKDSKLISPNFLKKLYNSIDWTYDFKYDNKKSFFEQNLSKDAKLILSIIYMRYFSSNEEKIEFMKNMKK